MKRSSRLFAVVAIAFLFAIPAGAGAADWTCGNADWWDNAGCWSGGAVPGAGDAVIIDNGGGTDVTVDYRNSLDPNLGFVFLNGTGAGTSILNIGQDSLTTDYEYIGVSGHTGYLIGGIIPIPGTVDGGTGTVNQSGGVHYINKTLRLGFSPIATGTYNMTGGVLAVGEMEYIGAGGGGVFNQSGGTHTVVHDPTVLGSGNLYIGQNNGAGGSYSLSNGTLRTGYEYIGGQGGGSFTQTGGTHEVAKLLSIAHIVGGTSGTYDMSGGVLSTGYEWIGSAGVGVFNQTGGSHTVAGDITLGRYGSASDGTYRLSGGSLNVGGEIKSGFSTGTLIIDGGTLLLGGGTGGKINVTNFSIGDAAGTNVTFTINTGESLSSRNTQYVGNNGIATLTQNDGYNNVWDYYSPASLVIGVSAGSQGTYNLNGGYLYTNYENIGQSGRGTVNQAGGTNTVNDGLVVGAGATGHGTYNLTGGALVASGVVVGASGTGVFNQSGATTINDIAGTLYVGLNPGGTGTYTLDSGDLTADRVVVGHDGTGTFNQNGGTNTVATTVTVAANAGSSGTYNLAGGTLNAQTVVNNGTFNYTGGVLNADLVNNAGSRFDIFGGGVYTVAGNMVNYGTVSVMNSTAYFSGTYTEHGAFMSDPSSVYFNDLVVGTMGYLVGTAGDTFYVGGDFINNSTQYSLWDTLNSTLVFSGSTSHAMNIAGGASTGSFAFGSIQVQGAGTLNFTGSSLYVNSLVLGAGSVLNLGGLNLYYTSITDLGGSYTGGAIYQVADLSQVPEPATIVLLSTAIAGAAAVGARRKRRT